MTSSRAILLISCPDRPGIIARVSNLLYSLDCNIIDSDQHTDDDDGHFFWRIFFESQSRKIDTVMILRSAPPCPSYSPGRNCTGSCLTRPTGSESS